MKGLATFGLLVLIAIGVWVGSLSDLSKDDGTVVIGPPRCSIYEQINSLPCGSHPISTEGTQP